MYISIVKLQMLKKNLYGFIWSIHNVHSDVRESFPQKIIHNHKNILENIHKVKKNNKSTTYLKKRSSTKKKSRSLLFLN